jgi:hypothetical protein
MGSSGEQPRRKALPVIIAEVEALKPRFQHAQHGRKPPRRPLRDLLATGQAQTRRDVAQRLGGHRHPIGHWLARDATGGLEALLDRYVPPGNPVSLPPDVLAGLEQALRQPAGFASCEAVRQWGKQQDHLGVKEHPLDTLARTRCNAKLRVPRPSHTQNPRGA